MNKIAKAIVVLLLSFAGTVHAVVLSLSPASQSLAVGDSTNIDLLISGLGDGTAPSLGAFLVEISFDEAILNLDSVTYGSALGDPDPLAFETDIVTSDLANSVILDEISFLFDFELDALQTDAFTLATLVFSGIADGTSVLGFGTIDLADAGFPANTLLVDDLQAASITVGQVAEPVDEPATFLLLLSGLILLSPRARWGVVVVPTNFVRRLFACG